MYLYFDKNGVLLEVINDEALRQYNQQVNTLYVFCEWFPERMQYWFERPNGDETEVYIADGDDIVTEKIPFDFKRDLKKFKYGVEYTMFKIIMPCGRVIGQDDDGNDVFEYNIFEDAGPVSLSLKAIYKEDEEELTLGKVVFTIEDEVVLPTNTVSVSQFEYLLQMVSSAAEASKDYNKLNNKPQINGVTLQGNKTAEELGVVPIVLTSFRALGTPPTKTFRQSANIFVNNDKEGFRMTLQEIKDMNTKIVDVKNKEDADFSQLDIGDYVYSEN